MKAREFFNRFIASSNNCLEWQGAIDDGYGRIKINGKTYYTHRVVWSLKRGKIPKGLFVLHKCDNSICGNIEHLYLGTHKQNMRDMVDRARVATGVKHGSAKLNWELVSLIRALDGKLTQATIAKKFNVSQTNVCHIMQGRLWRAA